jgi:hypothetical protein
MLLEYSDIPHFLPQTIAGIVYDKRNRLPLGNVLVYILKGEEESVTNIHGEFTIATWQHFPLILTIQTNGWPEIKKEVKSVSEKTIIYLV